MQWLLQVVALLTIAGAVRWDAAWRRIVPKVEQTWSEASIMRNVAPEAVGSVTTETLDAHVNSGGFLSARRGVPCADYGWETESFQMRRGTTKALEDRGTLILNGVAESMPECARCALAELHRSRSVNARQSMAWRELAARAKGGSTTSSTQAGAAGPGTMCNDITSLTASPSSSRSCGMIWWRRLMARWWEGKLEWRMRLSCRCSPRRCSRPTRQPTKATQQPSSSGKGTRCEQVRVQTTL